VTFSIQKQNTELLNQREKQVCHFLPLLMEAEKVCASFFFCLMLLLQLQEIHFHLEGDFTISGFQFLRFGKLSPHSNFQNIFFPLLIFALELFHFEVAQYFSETGGF